MNAADSPPPATWLDDPHFTESDAPSPRYLARLSATTYALSRHAVPEPTDKD